MRNLKKFLALVLAMVMAFSLMLTANAIDYDKYTDKDAVTEEFREAVAVLSGLKIMEGDGPEDAKTFRPGDTITRAEAAAVIYRIATQDVDGDQVQLYSDYGNFTDVKHDDWFAGYVGYCQNAGYIKGHAGRFNPYDKVTGYEMLAMILRVVGYGKNSEFTGTQWQVNVASMSRELGVINNVKSANFEHTLTMAARRDVVADLMFQTMTLVPVVTYTPALAYNDKTATLSTEFNPTLGQRNFGLWKAVPGGKVGNVTVPGADAVIDIWGRPGYFWVKDGSKVGVGSDNRPIYAGSATSPLGAETAPHTYAKVVATIKETPKLTYTTQIKECDLAHDYKIATEQYFSLYVNNEKAITNRYLVVATDTVTPVGGQGRLTEVYAPKGGSHTDHRVVMIDTVLAQVTRVTECVKDAAGHVIVPAKMDMNVYDNPNDINTLRLRGDAPSAKTISKEAGDDENWTYAKGDYILLNAYTNYNLPMGGWSATESLTETSAGSGYVPADYYVHNPLAATTAPANTYRVNLDPETTIPSVYTDDRVIEQQNKAAFQPNWVTSGTLTENANIVVLGKAESETAKQTLTYWNQGKHNVGGTDIPDAMLLHLDRAGTTTGTDFQWWKDQYGNIIGITPVGSVQYGVITSLYSSFNQGDSSTDGTAQVIAKVTLADGTETTMTISKFLLSNLTDANFNGHATAGTTLTTTANTVDLIPLYDFNSGINVMRATERVRPASESGAYQITEGVGYLHVAPVASVNATADNNNRADNGTPTYDGTYGIIKHNMFKFVSAANGTMMAVEVAGDGNTGTANFAGHYNAAVSTTYSATQNKLYKNLGYITVDNNGNDLVWLDNDTKIMVRNPNTGDITCYDGVNALPGDITLTASVAATGNTEATKSKPQEIDWVENDGDDRAEYLYVTGTVDGGVTYGLFYFDGGASQWNGTDKTGTMTGYWNGDAKTISFQGDSGKAMFDNILASMAGTTPYRGRMFALQMTNDVVSNLMANGAGASDYKLLDNGGAAVHTFNSNIKTTPYSGGYPGNVGFEVGTKGGNYYTDNTRMVWYNDNGGSNNGDFTVDYNRITRQITVNGKTDTGTTITNRIYTITGATKIIGNLDYLDPDADVDWLNDVTIVFEPNNIFAIDEIYITTQPTVTPGDQTGRYIALLERTSTSASELCITVDHTKSNGYSGTVETQVWAYNYLDDQSTAKQVDSITGAAATAMSNGQLNSGNPFTVVRGARSDTMYFVKIVRADTGAVLATSNAMVGTRN